MSGGVVTAEHNQAGVAAVAPNAWRRVRLLALILGIRGAGDLPYLLAAGLIQGDHPVSARMQQRQIEPVFVQDRRGVDAVLDLEGAVALLHVELPDLITCQIKTGQIARADKGPDVFTVGAG